MLLAGGLCLGGWYAHSRMGLTTDGPEGLDLSSKVDPSIAPKSPGLSTLKERIGLNPSDGKTPGATEALQASSKTNSVHVRGTVRDELQAAVPGVDVVVAVGYEHFQGEKYLGRTDHSGGFEVVLTERPAGTSGTLVFSGESTGGGVHVIAEEVLFVHGGALLPVALRATSQRLTLSGRVVDAEGWPLPGGAVRDVSGHTVRTSVNGTFEITIPMPSRAFTLYYGRESRACTDKFSAHTSVFDLTTGSVDGLELVCTEVGPEISVNVQSNGLPLESATVRCLSSRSEAASDGDGNAPVITTGLPPWHVVVSKPGFQRRRLAVNATDLLVEVELAPLKESSGTVVDSAGDPVPGATVLASRSIYSSGDLGVLSTGADGVFRFWVPHGGGEVFFTAEASPDLSASGRAWCEGDEESWILLQMRSKVALQGEVKDAEGQPVTAARLSISGGGGLPPAYSASDELGRFSVAYPDVGRCSLSVRKAGYHAYTQECELPGRLDVLLQSRKQARLKVMAASGSPLTSFKVRLTCTNAIEQADWTSAKNFCGVGPFSIDLPEGEHGEEHYCEISASGFTTRVFRISPYEPAEAGHQALTL